MTFDVINCNCSENDLYKYHYYSSSLCLLGYMTINRLSKLIYCKSDWKTLKSILIFLTITLYSLVCFIPNLTLQLFWLLITVALSIVGKCSLIQDDWFIFYTSFFSNSTSCLCLISLSYVKSKVKFCYYIVNHGIALHLKSHYILLCTECLYCYSVHVN